MSTTEEHHFHHAPDQTELEKWINSTLEKIEPYSNQILLGFIVVTVLAVGGIFWSRNADTVKTAGWADFVAASTPDDFADLAEEFPDTPVGQFAQLQAGRQYLNEGLNAIMTNRSVANEQLNNAKEQFDNLLKQNPPPEVREEALYGLAASLEALSDGDNEPAIKAYEQLVSEFENSKHAKWAQTRIEELKSDDASQFYAWFHKQNPSPDDRPKPSDVSTEDKDAIKLPDLGLEKDTSTGDLKAPALPAKEMPADAKSEDAPADEKKAGEFPKGEDKPAADDKPADKPADEKPAEAKPEEAKPESEAPAEKTEESTASDSDAEASANDDAK